MATIQSYPRFKALLDDGTPAVGYKVYAYSVGTTNPKDTYADQAALTPNANPVILDGSGEATIFFGTGGYKLVLTDPSDVVVWTLDGLNLPGDILADSLTVSGSTSLQALSVTSLATSSSTKVANLNADHLDDKDWASPAALGSGTPAAITGTVVIANTSAQVGSSGTPLTQITVYTPTLTPAACNANTTAEQTFTVTGLTTADKVIVNKPTSQAGLGIVGVRVTAADTLGITYSNNTGSPITPTASEVYPVIAIRS